MAVFPDSVDTQTPMIGYLPGPMPWQLSAELERLGVRLANKKADDSCCIDRKLITGASPAAADKLGKLAATTLLDHLAQGRTSAPRERPMTSNSSSSSMPPPGS